jgi:hypothetical protein
MLWACDDHITVRWMLLPSSRYYGPVKLSTTRSAQYIRLIVTAIRNLSIIISLFLLTYHRYKMIVIAIRKLPIIISFFLLTYHRYKMIVTAIQKLPHTIKFSLLT